MDLRWLSSYSFSLTPYCDEKGCFYNRVCFFSNTDVLLYDLTLALAGEEAYFDDDDDDDDDDYDNAGASYVQNQLSSHSILFSKKTNKVKVS